MEDKRIRILRDEKISTAVIKMSLPAIIGFFVMVIYNLTDTMFVSWISYEAPGATQIVFPIMLIASSIGLMFGVGAASYVSRLLGEKKYQVAETVISIAVFSSIFIGLFYVIIVEFNIVSLLHAFGAKENLLQMAIDYGKYIIIGSLFIMPSMTLTNILRAEGSPKFGMIGMLVGSFLNIILDPILMFGLDMGIKGASIATAVSQLISLSLLLSFYIRKKTVLHLDLKKFRLDISIYKEIFKIGIPTFIKQLLISVSMGLLNKAAVLYGGDFLLSAMGITIKITGIPMYFILGTGQGVQPVVGYNFGAGNIERVKKTALFGIKMSVFGAVFSALLFFPFARVIMSFFSENEKVINYGIEIIKVTSIAIIFMGVSNTINALFLALGKGKVSMFLATARQGTMYIPFILIMPIIMGYKGVIYAQLIADILTFIISIIIYKVWMNKGGAVLNENQ